MPTIDDVLAVAAREVGYREGPSNSNKYGAWYGMNNSYWCAQFISWVAAHAGAALIIPRHAYTPNGVQWFQQRGQWGSQPRRGAIVYFDFPNDGKQRVSHVGIVESVNPSGSIVTIEGNTGSSGGDNGDGVYRKTRTSSWVGFGYPKYDVRPASVDNTKLITEIASVSLTVMLLPSGAQVAIAPGRGVKTIPNLEYAQVISGVADKILQGNKRQYDIVKEFFGQSW